MASETATIQNGILSGGWGNTASDYAKELASVASDLNTPGKVTNPQDRLNLQAYQQTLLGQQAATSATTAGTNNASSAGAIGSDYPNLSAADQQTIKDYQTNPTDNLDTASQNAVAGGDGSTGPLAYVKANIGNVGIVVLGVVVLAVALVAAVKSGPQIVQSVKGAVS